MLAELREFGAAQALAVRRDELLGGMACHAAVRANRSLSLPEMNALLRADGADRALRQLQPRPAHLVQLRWPTSTSLFLRGR